MKRVKPTKRLPSGSLTFMFTDIVFSAEIQRTMPGESSSERSDAFLKLIKQPHDRIVRTTIASHGGTIIKGTGDGFLVTFKDAEKAVLCGVKAQEKLKQATIQTRPSGQLQIRIGLNSGYAEPRNNDYVSSAVDKAKRVESHCVSGQVYLSSETHGLVAGKLPTLLIQSVGFQKMKSFGKQKLFVAVRLDQTAHRNKPNEGLLPEPNIPFDPTLRKAVVVIGDEDEKRFEWFKALLAEVYQTEAVRARTLEEVKKLARTLS